METNEITGIIVDRAIKIHRLLGPGLYESVYEAILEYELRRSDLQVTRQVDMPVFWDGHHFQTGFRADMIVEGRVIVELKSLERTLPVHRKQLITYLKVSGLSVGLLLNFGEAQMADGISRLVHNFVS